MTTEPHLILGAGGAIGHVLTHELIAHGKSVKLVSRSGHTLPGAGSAKADLLDAQQTAAVIEPGSIVYVVAGLPYRTSVWEDAWPRLIRNVIDGCAAREARLIFFDNIYMYGHVHGPITEETPVDPCSKKGEVRARIAETLLTEARSGRLHATIARAADFYGPHAEATSIPALLFIKNLAAGKKAQVLVDARRRHSYTFTGDCGKALRLLAGRERASGEIWHLPTARPAPTSEEFVAIAARHLGAKPGIMVLRKWMVRMAGLVDAQIRELYEMLYQNEYDYEFDSSRFEQAFDFTPTPYEEGIAITIRQLRESGAIRS